MKLSIIVPIYNVQKYLARCLASLKKQALSAEEVEFLLIDDGSTDKGLKIANDFASKDERFKVFHKKNSGYGATINFGIEHACGDYVGIVEPDDWCDDTMFSTMLKVAQQNDLDIVRCNYVKFWTKPYRTEVIESSPHDMYGQVFYPRDLKECFFFHPAIWSMIVKRELIINNDLHLLETPGASFQDTSYSFKLWAVATRAMCLDESFLHYRQDNESSSINNPKNLEFVCLEYKEIEKFLNEDKKRFGELISIAQRRKFLAYVWNYERVDKSLHKDFASKMRCEFKEAQNRGEIDESLFSKSELSDLRRLLNSSDNFVKFKDSYPRILRKILHEIDYLKNR